MDCRCHIKHCQPCHALSKSCAQISSSITIKASELTNAWRSSHLHGSLLVVWCLGVCQHLPACLLSITRSHYNLIIAEGNRVWKTSKYYTISLQLNIPKHHHIILKDSPWSWPFSMLACQISCRSLNPLFLYRPFPRKQYKAQSPL